ncbi:TnsA endonuclease N-terminal domain-containing protein [Alteromonas australica]|uniref:TnsA endonuclease N-terminal domain-containing protein n=1 Tax=Alteromonas australica TaxID=589873 RepID=UPI0035C7F459
MAKRFNGVTLERQQGCYEKHAASVDTDSYEPMWLVTDIKSWGTKAKVKHFCDFNRAVHVLSQNEMLMFMLIAWNKQIVQSYEQYALPLEDSLYIANELGVKHPVYPNSKGVPIQQTLDFFCYEENGGRIGYAVKQEDELFKTRSVEKLAIQEAWCEINDYKFELVTSATLKNENLVNLERIYRHRVIPAPLELACNAWRQNFLSLLSNNRHERLADVLEESALLSGLPYQTAARFFYHCLWHLKLDFNWSCPLRLELSAEQLGVFANE